MKSSTQVFVALIATLATLSQSVIATPRRITTQNSFNVPTSVKFIPPTTPSGSRQEIAATQSKSVATIKMIKMEKNKTYHCHEKGSERIQKARSNFRCELMKQDNVNNPYDYATTNKIVNLFCSDKLTGTIEYDEGRVYKFLMTCKKNEIANPISHKIGFVKISQSMLGQTGALAYWMRGSRNENNIVFFADSTTQNPLMNIDGNSISLNLVDRQKNISNRNIRYVDTYKSGVFTIKVDSRNASTAKDRKNFVTRDIGTITITSNDGWRKKIEVEAAHNTGG